MQYKSMDAFLSLLEKVRIPPVLSMSERQVILKEHQQLMEENTKLIEELRHTMKITVSLLTEVHVPYKSSTKKE